MTFVEDCQERVLLEVVVAGARARLNDPDLSHLIAPTIERLAERPDRDPSRPGIEFYRRHDLVDLLLPVV